MADFTALAATAKQLIDSNGRAVVITKHGNAPQDSDKPWRGQATYPEAEVSGNAAFVSPSDLGKVITNLANTSRAVQVALFAANDDDGEELEFFDSITDDDSRWGITFAEVLQPGDTRLLYMFGVRR